LKRTSSGRSGLWPSIVLVALSMNPAAVNFPVNSQSRILWFGLAPHLLQHHKRSPDA
jgi:hypothetical protein